MRTTIRLRDDLLDQARLKAATEGRTLTSLVEEGLHIVLAAPASLPRGGVVIPVSSATGGVLPGVDLDDSSALQELMNEE